MAEDKRPFVFEGEGYEDLNDALLSLEREYRLSYDYSAIEKATSIQEILDVVYKSFLNLDKERKEDCTSQQAFYKLKSVLQKYCEEAVITPSSQLETLISRENRIATIGMIDGELGFKLHVLRPKESLEITLWAVLLCLIIMFFFIPLYALVGSVIWVFVCQSLYSNAKEFKVETVGELVKQMVMNNYFKSRRDPNTINEQELRKVVVSYLADSLGLTEEELVEAQFG
ncbi:hypothetical protein [Myroides marinus]|uniref:hypothetical protein n=1 Tax=Myroides marinus TaxID=703342 RepID=UPI002575AF02|nr:hypothetical protein [Myroides marinus]MDM1404855.1 hypothetical protein [Myroides marinus]MDM1531773.1 hypothetical protein [Myroides marinus]MDM1538803.1 hypothetical protein [Myroides marinus]